jgi:small subunit ribosomal protein S11
MGSSPVGLISRSCIKRKRFRRDDRKVVDFLEAHKKREAWDTVTRLKSLSVSEVKGVYRFREKEAVLTKLGGMLKMDHMCEEWEIGRIPWVYKQIREKHVRIRRMIKESRQTRRRRKRTWYMIRKDIKGYRRAYKDDMLKFDKARRKHGSKFLPKNKKRKAKKIRFYILCKETFNNIMGTLVTKSGKVLVKCNSGTVGFAGSKRNSKYAASVVGLAIGKKARAKRIGKVTVKLKRRPTGKIISFFRGFRSSGIKLRYLKLGVIHTHASVKVRKPRRV